MPCGTSAAYARHHRNNTPVCDACSTAKAADSVARRQAVKDVGDIAGRARDAALEALAHRHADEYAALYAAALREETA